MELPLCSVLAFGLVGGSELVIVLVIALLLFGARLIPRFARGIAQTPVEFMKARKEGRADLLPGKSDSGEVARRSDV